MAETPKVPAESIAEKLLPFALPDVGSAEARAMTRSLRSGWLTSGPEVKAFESEFATLTGAREAIAVNSCTAALHLALAAWDIGADDAVLVPDLTFVASAEVITYSGALPIVLDVNRADYLLDGETVERFLKEQCDTSGAHPVHRASKKTVRAIIPVHYGGRPCDLDQLSEIAKRHKLKLLEDAAHAFPTYYAGRILGTHSDATAFSFYATKNLTTGEGGMLTTDDSEFADRVRRMRLHGIRGQTYGRQRWQYDVVDQGFKYNMMDPCAAIGRVQLKRTAETLEKRKLIHAAYDRAFARLQGVRLTPRTPHESAFHLYTIELGPGARLSRDEFVDEMYRRGIAVSLHFIPIHRLTYYRDAYGLSAQQFPNAEEIFQRICSLPIYSALKMRNVRHVIEAVRELLG